MAKIAIIGAGIAGLACARFLSDAGLSPIVFDKGRGIGGRVATRRADEGLQFDHGAQYVKSTDPVFQSVLGTCCEAGALARWKTKNQEIGYVGAPRMTALAKHLGQGIEIRQKAQVTTVLRGDDKWHVGIDKDAQAFDRVVCTAPAPQTLALLQPHLPAALASDAIDYDPCLTLMIALKTHPDLPDTAKCPTKAFAWVAHDSSKPNRSSTGCWVVQASADWSQQHLEKTKDEICALMSELFLDHACLSSKDVIYASAHRWRYAFVAKPLGQSFVKDTTQTLYAGGDWCLGPRVEHAWQSGTAIAKDLIAGV